MKTLPITRLEPLERTKKTPFIDQLRPPEGFVDYWDWGNIKNTHRGVRTGRLANWLREASQTKNAGEILRRAVIAAFKAPSPGVDLEKASIALADLAVTGSSSYENFKTININDDELFSLVENDLLNIDPSRIRIEVIRVLDRAYTVAWALKGSSSQREQLRTTLGWIALSSEDDSPHSPTNISSNDQITGEIDLTIGRSSFEVTLRATLKLPNDAKKEERNEFSGRNLPKENDLLSLLNNRSETGFDDLFIFIHGLGSRAEESGRFKTELIKEGNCLKRRYAILSIDLPGMGYSRRLDLDELVSIRSNGHHGFALPNGGGSNFPLLGLFRDTLVVLANRIKGGVQYFAGGSLGGNLVLWLASEPMFSDLISSQDYLSSVRGYLCWSPASIWESYERSRDTPFESNGTHMDIGKNGAKKVALERMREIESGDSRWNFFEKIQRGEEILGINALGAWGFPPSPGGLLLQSELYSENYRRTFWAAAYEQVTFSHQEPLTPSGRWPFQTITKPLFLAAGSKDRGDKGVMNIFHPVIQVSDICKNVTGIRHLLYNTGHSISDERPKYLASIIIDFITNHSYINKFPALYAGGGIASYDLQDSRDRIIAYDFDSSGKMDHLLIYRPGTGIVWILKNDRGSFTRLYKSSNGIGGYDLLDSRDRIITYDFDSSGKMDHLLIYRPSTGIVWILKNDRGSFTHLYKSSNGIGGYDLLESRDRIIAYDFGSSGKMDHLLAYRPGARVAWIIKRYQDSFTYLHRYTAGIGGYDLRHDEDTIIAYDYLNNKKSDHLLLYRPGKGIVWILKNDRDSFMVVYQSPYGIGGYDLKDHRDTIISYYLSDNNRSNNLLLCRPGRGIVWILENNEGEFEPFFKSSSYYNTSGGIGGYDLLEDNDKITSFDYYGSGFRNQLVAYRPGKGIIWLLNELSLQVKSVRKENGSVAFLKTNVQFWNEIPVEYLFNTYKTGYFIKNSNGDKNFLIYKRFLTTNPDKEISNNLRSLPISNLPSALTARRYDGEVIQYERYDGEFGPESGFQVTHVKMADFGQNNWNSQISYLCNDDEGYQLMIEKAELRIKKQNAEYYIESTDGAIHSLKLREFLTTNPDDNEENNLLSLPET